MHMDMVLQNFSRLCELPAVWAILGLMVARALFSIYGYFRCPIFNHGASMDAESDRAAVQGLFVRSPRFLMTMIVGLGLAIGGIYSMQEPDIGPFAVAAVLLGVFLLIVEPSRLTVEENTRRVSAARLDGDDAVTFAMERLRASHVERLAMEVGMVLLLGFVVLSFDAPVG